MCGNWITFGGVRAIGGLTTEENEGLHGGRGSLLYHLVLLDHKPYSCVVTEENKNDNLPRAIMALLVTVTALGADGPLLSGVKS